MGRFLDGQVSAVLGTHTHVATADERILPTSDGLYEKKNAHGENLSYGQRKLLEIGRVMAMDAKIILLDEPFAGLFPEMVKVITSFVKEWKQEDKTIILVEHNMAIIRELCEHVIVMDAGKLLAEGSTENVLNQRNVIEAYLGE